MTLEEVLENFSKAVNMARDQAMKDSGGLLEMCCVASCHGTNRLVCIANPPGVKVALLAFREYAKLNKMVAELTIAELARDAIHNLAQRANDCDGDCTNCDKEKADA